MYSGKRESVRLHYGAISSSDAWPDGIMELATNLLRLDAGESEISRRLSRRIRAEIEAHGWMGLDRFMERALHEPDLGYYNNGSIKFGPRGDFMTAPELSPALARALAPQIAAVLRSLDHPILLEVGAGTGRLAVDLSRALLALGVRARYRIAEPSPELRRRQQERCAAAGVEVRWFEDLPDQPFEGAIVANEVLDAFPATCFVKRAGVARPLGVGCTDDGFAWMEGPEDADLSRLVVALETRLGCRLEDGYRSEISRRLPSWMRRLAAVLHRGAAFILDYGMTESDYYHPQRTRGTLICHRGHRAHDDPFLVPGMQDISAWVDFSACARAAREAGLSIAGFTTQGQFIVESGTLPAFPAPWETATPAAAQALKTLVLPGEMGERFKLLVLSRGMTPGPLPGRDFRARL